MAQAPLTKCSLCSERDGSSFCSECKQILCPSCRNIHSKIPLTAKHKITDLNKVDRLLPESEFSCEAHNEQYVLSCTTCKCFICSACVISNHKGHAYSGIDEMTREVRKTINDFISNAKQQMVEISTRKDTMNTVHIPNIQKDCKDQLADIDEITSEIHQACDTLKAVEVSNISEYEKVERDRCESYIEKLDKINNKYGTTCRRFEDLLTESHDITLYRQYNMYKGELQLDNLSDIPVPRRSSFPLEGFIENVLKKLHSIYPTSIEKVIYSMAEDKSLKSRTSTKSSDWNKNLLYAARDGDYEGIMEALKMNANINWSSEEYLTLENEFRSYYGWNGSPLHIAAMLGHVGCVIGLIDNGARQNVYDNQGDLPIHAAVAFGENQCMQALLNNGATVSDRSIGDFTPLHEAATSGATDCMAELISRGADVSAVAGKIANMPIHNAAHGCHTKCIRILIENGSTVMDRNNKDETPLHCVIRSPGVDDGKDDVLHQLIALGASPQAKDIDGITPYDVAVEKRNSYWMMLFSEQTHHTEEMPQPYDVMPQSNPENDGKKGKKIMKKTFFRLGRR